MTCHFVKLPGGGRAIICTPRQRGHTCRCRVGDRHSSRLCLAAATYQCDWPQGRGTCDRYLCGRCAHEIEPDKHLCPLHARLYGELRRQGELALQLGDREP